MFAVHGQLPGALKVVAGPQHKECDCITVTITDGVGQNKIAVDLDNPTRLYQLGQVLVELATKLGGTDAPVRSNDAH